MADDKDYLTKGEFNTWKDEHTRFLDAHFNKLCASINEIKASRVADWKIHRTNHKEAELENEESLKKCREECDEAFNCNVNSVNKNFKWVWISIAGLFVVLIVSHPQAVLGVGKTIISLFK